MDERIPVAVLGASGLVGQRFQQRLAIHPWFELVCVAGSDKSVGKRLSEIPWRLPEKRPILPDLEIISCQAKECISQLEKTNCQLVFSALPNGPAKEIERKLESAGFHVFSNASAHREISGIPLVIADLNPQHLLNSKQAIDFHNKGTITCSTNCTVVPIAMPLKALSQIGELERVEVFSQQALSGGGWELLNNPEAQKGNVDPHIPGEEEKVESELRYLFGKLEKNIAGEDIISPAEFEVSAKCMRVAEEDGHLVEVTAYFKQNISTRKAIKAINDWSEIPQLTNLPSAPTQIMEVCQDIPTRKEHLWAGMGDLPPRPAENLRAGMAITVGRISNPSTNIIHFYALSHNTIRGAAGGCLLLAELAFSRLINRNKVRY